ncbi:DNA repair exonuclease [Candidatus Woesearchaeota archaeon]|nr:DNA repair exonuclease [Candidatus Woesearchaeota archaeon]
MKFAHMADCHLGGWRDPRLRLANSAAFEWVIRKCIGECVDFVLIAGDLFNSAVPSIESLQCAVQGLMDLRRAGIPVYAIAGSHDFSPSGRTMFDVLETAGLLTNVAMGAVENDKLCLKFTVDPKTKVKITGMVGRIGGLEKGYYHDLDVRRLEEESGCKIFLFHSAIEELKPKGMEKMVGMAGSLLPKGFDYYAGGHVHVTDHAQLEERHNIVFPGPVFPNNFAELEKLKQGSFCVVADGVVRHVPVEVHPVRSVVVDAEGREPQAVEEEVVAAVKAVVADNAIVTVRVQGCLKSGKPSGLNWQRLNGVAGGALVVLKNTSQLVSRELNAVRVPAVSVEEVEHAVIAEYVPQVLLTSDDKVLVSDLMGVFQQERQEGERVGDFENRVVSRADSVLREGPV